MYFCEIVAMTGKVIKARVIQFIFVIASPPYKSTRS
jgi:hypothetical protein